MALTTDEYAEGVMGDKAYWIGSVTFDSSYDNDGEELLPATLKMNDFIHLSLTPDNLAQDTGLYPAWDVSANKIMLFEGNSTDNPLAEITASDNVSAYIVYVWALGSRVLN